MASPVERIAARLIRLENRVAGLATGPQLAYSAIEDGALEEYDKFDQLVTIIGKQPDGTHGAVSVSGPTPPRPSVAVVSGGPGLLNYGWDGNFAGSDGKADITIPAPMDFARVEAHASKMQGFTADTAATLLDTLESPRGGSRTAMVEPGTWYVVLVARSHSGKRSAQSVEVAIEVLPPIGSDIDVEALREEFRAVDEQMNKDLLANQGELTAAQKRIDSLTSKVTPLESALQTLEQSTLPGIQTQINTKNKTINSTTNAAGSTGYTSGDTWQKWSSLDDSGRLLAAWRFTVNKTWSPVLLDPTYLPQVDIGAGTFGSLEGGRLSSGSVTTRELVVGSFTNLVENPAWEYGTKSWTSWSNGWSVETSGGRRTAPVLRFTGSTTRTLGPQSSNMPLDLAGEQVGDNTGAKFRVSGWVRTTSAGSTRGELCLYTYAANGTTFLTNRNFNIDGATSEWKYFSTIMEAPRANAAYVRLRLNATLSTASDEYFFDDLSVVNAVEGNVIVDGTIKGIHVDAESVAAKVGAFVEADIGKLRVTGSTNLNTLVAQRIAANVGSYLKLYANQVFVGHPGNMMPDPGFNDAGMTALRNQHSTIAVDLSADNDLRLNNTSTGLQYLRPYGTPQTQAGVLGGGWIAVEPGQVWTLKFKVSAWKGTTGWAQFVGRTADGSAYANPYPSGGPKSRANITSSSQDVEVEATIPENCYWIIPEVAVAPGGFSYIKRNTMVLTQKITPALIVDGLMNGQRIIGASIESNAELNRGVKINDNGLYGFDTEGTQYLRADSEGLNIIGTVASEGTSKDTWQSPTIGEEVRTRILLSRKRRGQNDLNLTPGLWFETEPLNRSRPPLPLPAGINSYAFKKLGDSLSMKSGKTLDSEEGSGVSVGPGVASIEARGASKSGWTESASLEVYGYGGFRLDSRRMIGPAVRETFRLESRVTSPESPAELYSYSGLDISGGPVTLNGDSLRGVTITEYTCTGSKANFAATDQDISTPVRQAGSSTATLATPSTGTLTILERGIYGVDFQLTLYSNSGLTTAKTTTGRSFVDIADGNDVAYSRTGIQVGEDQGTGSMAGKLLTAGAKLKFRFIQTTGGLAYYRATIRLIRYS